MSSRLKSKVPRFRDEAKQASLEAKEKTQGDIAQKCEKYCMLRAAVINSTAYKAKAKPGKKETDEKEKVVKSKAANFKLNKQWLASAAQNAGDSPFEDQLVRVCV